MFRMRGRGGRKLHTFEWVESERRVIRRRAIYKFVGQDFYPICTVPIIPAKIASSLAPDFQLLYPRTPRRRLRRAPSFTPPWEWPLQ